MIQCSHDYFFPGHLSQSTFPDLSLTTPDGGGRHIPAHRVVLAAVSSKLAGLCNDGGTVVVRNISFQVLEKSIRFIYNGKITLNSGEDVTDLRDGLDMLKMNVVIEQVISAQPGLNREMTEDHCSEAFCEKTNGDENSNINSSGLSKLVDMTVSEASRGNRAEHSIDTFCDLFENESGLNSANAKDSVVSNSGQVKPTSKRKAKTYKIQSREVVCDYCGSSLLYRKYVDHCKNLHPSSPWNTKSKCGTCKNYIPEVILNFHLKMFGHKVISESEDQNLSRSKHLKLNGSYSFEDNSNSIKAQTKISCNYCEEQVTFSSYVKHCMKLHSISDSNDRCRKKCFKCGANVHIVAEKFHDMIYHPVPATPRPRQERDESEPLKIVEHNKNLTKVPCDFCHVKIVYASYKSHVRNKHPEVAYAKLVSCTKCGSKVPKISFKYHRLIFHHSDVLKPLKVKIVPKIKIPCAKCDARVKPRMMVLHMQTVHGTGGSQAKVFSKVNTDGIKKETDTLEKKEEEEDDM